MPDGLLVGTDEAHLLRLDDHTLGRVAPSTPWRAETRGTRRGADRPPCVPSPGTSADGSTRTCTWVASRAPSTAARAGSPRSTSTPTSTKSSRIRTNPMSCSPPAPSASPSARTGERAGGSSSNACTQRTRGPSPSRGTRSCSRFRTGPAGSSRSVPNRVRAGSPSREVHRRVARVVRREHRLRLARRSRIGRGVRHGRRRSSSRMTRARLDASGRGRPLDPRALLRLIPSVRRPLRRSARTRTRSPAHPNRSRSAGSQGRPMHREEATRRGSSGSRS